MFTKILIANRGEISTRISRTCRELGVRSVAVHSDADVGALHVRSADEAVHLPGTASVDTYLKVEAIIEAALGSGAEAIHPGYGFLSENADFAAAVAGAGLVWIGPPPEAIRALGDKISARSLAEAASVPIVPGISEAIEDHSVLLAFGRDHGYPLAIKASGGGGGRGLKVARSEGEVEAAFAAARREAEAYFGSRDVFVERYLDGPKHLEVQVLAPGGAAEPMWLGVRDCSFQRRHQKLIEETPPPLFAGKASEMGSAAVALAKASGYVNAGTVEMLTDKGGDFYFLEVNARLQVEHTVTEEVFGLDLVACQLKIASGDDLGFEQGDLTPRGHALECRINAEDPTRGFIPTPGRITRYEEPKGVGVRVDGGYEAGDVVPEAYDSLIAKLITHGSDREQARGRMLRALEDFHVEGISTSMLAHLHLLEEPSFVEGTHTTRTLEDEDLLGHLTAEADADGSTAVLLVEGRPVSLWSPAMAASATAAVAGGAAGDAVAPMQGTILKVLVDEGQQVELGDPMVILEAMKMETVISAPRPGAVTEVLVAPGDNASAGQSLVVVEAPASGD